MQQGGSQYGAPPHQQPPELTPFHHVQMAPEAAPPISTRPPPPAPAHAGGGASAAAAAAYNFDELGAAADDPLGGVGEEGGSGGISGNRWPRQETLALLKIRSDMDATFRDATLKGPLWEEVSRWSLIAGRIPGRTANDIKNYWNSHLGKRLDAQHRKKHEPLAINVGVLKPRPQRVSKIWMWPKNDGNESIEPRLPTTVAGQDESWLNELFNCGHHHEEELVHDQFPRTDSLSSLDFHFSCDVEEVMDEALIFGGIKEWERLLLQDNNYFEY